MVDKKSKKREVNIDKLEQMINKFNKKKSLSKPSTDLMSKINQRIKILYIWLLSISNIKYQRIVISYNEIARYLLDGQDLERRLLDFLSRVAPVS